MTWRKSLIGIAAFTYAAWKEFWRAEGVRNEGLAAGKRIVILGGGFGGVEAARELGRLLPDPGNGEIIVVDEHDYMLFTPMLTEAVGGDVRPEHIIVPIRDFSSRIDPIVARVTEIDLKKRTVTLQNHSPDVLTADHLVIALGATTSFHHIPGAEAKALPMKSLDDANAVRRGALSLLRLASVEADPKTRSAMLTFIVAGGGYTGAETIAALNDLIRDEAAAYPSIHPSDIRMIIAEPMDRLMMEVTPDLAAYTQKELERAGVEVLVKTGVKSVDGDKVELTNGDTVLARTLIWTAGVEPNALVMKLDAPKGQKKGLQVDACLALKDHDGVWALGDCAEVPQPGGKSTYGGTAQNATRQGILVAQNMVRSLKREPLQPIRYTPIGELAVVGKRRAVARVYGFNFSGFIAWLMWRAIYIAKLPSFRQQARVVADYLLDTALGHVTGSSDDSPAQGGRSTESHSLAAHTS